MKVLILGGRGFLGKALCEVLKGHDVYTFDTSEDGYNHFKGSILNVEDLIEAMKGIDCVVNLVGLTPISVPKKVTYEQIHVEGVRNIISACKNEGVKKLIHISALGADKNSDIAYIKTKGLGQELVVNADLKTVAIRPAIIIDKENELIRQLSKTSLTCMFPNIPAKMQPVYRGDVVKIILMAIEGNISEDIVDVAGPDVLTIFQMAKKIYGKKGFPCIPFPFSMFKIMIRLMSFLKLFGITGDQIKMFNLDVLTGTNEAEKYIQLTGFDEWLKSEDLK
jgi:NADH dehydrogenase